MKNTSLLTYLALAIALIALLRVSGCTWGLIRVTVEPVTQVKP